MSVRFYPSSKIVLYLFYFIILCYIIHKTLLTQISFPFWPSTPYGQDVDEILKVWKFEFENKILSSNRL